MDKLKILADAAKYDASCASSGSQRKRAVGGIGNTEGMGICHSYTPDGRCVSLLKILLTNYCIYDCRYCINRISSEVPRARFTPEEVAEITLNFYKRNYIEGLFLSSGVRSSPDETMAELVRTAEILRTEHHFGGYIHLKAVPGASAELLARAGRYADRLSANIELPEQDDLDRLAPGKNHNEIEVTMQSLKTCIDENQSEIKKPVSNLTPKRSKPKMLPAGQTTQLIVGATPSSDASLLAKSWELYKKYRLRRVYYSAYSPIQAADASLPVIAPPLVREHRLYQADWLFRFYGFAPHEIVSGPNENLDLDQDPKMAWAMRNRGYFPIDLNHASRGALLRVPGLGVRSVDRILKSRRHRKIRLEDLKKIRVSVDKVKFFLCSPEPNEALRKLDSIRLPELVAGIKLPDQLSLFSSAASARSGEL